MSLSEIINGATQTFDKVKELVEKYIPDKGVQNNFLSDLNIGKAKLELELARGQLEMNMDANKSPEWRNQFAKICIWAFFYHIFMHPFIMQVLIIVGHPVTSYTFDMNALNQAIWGLLGLGTFETVHTGVKSYLQTKENINASNNPSQ